MKDFASYIRVILIVGLVFIAAEYMIDSGDIPAFIKYPEVLVFMAFFTITLVGIEIMLSAMNTISEAMMSEEQKAAALAKKQYRKENSWYKKALKKLTKTRPIAEEGEIILDHNYDGIQELDNALPPWWLYGFYLTIVFAAIYLLKYEVFGADGQYETYDHKMEEARLAIEEYKRTAKDLVDANTVELLTDAADLSRGETIFNTNCVACHMADGGGGIGPNLTDDYWILGGGIKNVFHTISEGGRDGKGMISWKQTLKPAEIAQVASFVVSLQGTTPANPKEPQGDIWVDPDAPEGEAPAMEAAPAADSTATDTIAVEMPEAEVEPKVD